MYLKEEKKYWDIMLNKNKISPFSSHDVLFSKKKKKKSSHDVNLDILKKNMNIHNPIQVAIV